MRDSYCLHRTALRYMKDEVRCSVNGEQLMRRAFHGIGGMPSKRILKYALTCEQEVEDMLEQFADKRRCRTEEEAKEKAAKIIQAHWRERYYKGLPSSFHGK